MLEKKMEDKSKNKVEHLLGKKIQDLVESENIPVIGAAPTSALSDEPKGYRPEDVLPGAKSVVCFGIPIPKSRGTVL